MVDREFELAFAAEERWIERDKERIARRDLKPESVKVRGTVLRRGSRR